MRCAAGRALDHASAPTGVDRARDGKPPRGKAGTYRGQNESARRPEIIEALCEASCANVPIDLIVRGFCCLRPGIPGRTENVRVRSIIGRFLEHSRIFHFANGSEDPADGEFFIGSADRMSRNLSKRIEVVTPVLAAAGKQKLWEILDACLRDRRQAWTLDAHGRYTRLHPEGDGQRPETLGAQQILMNLTRERMSA
jgi:polyphosphate kinase